VFCPVAGGGGLADHRGDIVGGGEALIVGDANGDGVGPFPDRWGEAVNTTVDAAIVPVGDRVTVGHGEGVLEIAGVPDCPAVCPGVGEASCSNHA
jgi:hypothetical protein